MTTKADLKEEALDLVEQIKAQPDVQRDGPTIELLDRLAALFVEA